MVRWSAATSTRPSRITAMGMGMGTATATPMLRTRRVTLRRTTVHAQRRPDGRTRQLSHID
jgi:hypothetical protein